MEKTNPIQSNELKINAYKYIFMKNKLNIL